DGFPLTRVLPVSTYVSGVTVRYHSWRLESIRTATPAKRGSEFMADSPSAPIAVSGNGAAVRGTESVDIFAPYRLGDLELRSRLVMAPMTRSRAVDGNVPSPHAITYYTQRASAGLIVT